MMKLTRYDSADEFYHRAEPYLVQREAVHNLTLGICGELIRYPERFKNPYLAIIESGGHIVGTAVNTPPYYLVLSHMDSVEPIAVLARDVSVAIPDLAGTLGPVALSKAFAEQWTALTGQAHRLTMSERIFQLDTVKPVKGVSGQMRWATEADRALLREWIIRFETEALPGSPARDVDAMIDRMLHTDNRGGLLWEDPQPVALAGYGGLTPHGIRIGPVYTPKEYRRKGYASACVAALSQHLLDSGRKFCFLYTDLSNPTSNHIYQQIGYRPVSDVDDYRFTA